MTAYMSPQVVIREVDVSQVISSVATSIGVIVLRNTYRGAELKQTFLTNTDDLIQAFGEPTTVANAYKDMLSAEGFLKYGNALYATRVMPTDATFAGGSVTNYVYTATPAVSSAMTLSDLTSKDPDSFATEGLSGKDFYFIASSRGAWGNNVRVGMLDYSSQTAILTGGTAYQAFDTSGSWVGIDSRLALNDNGQATNFLIQVQVKDQGTKNFVTKEIFNVSTEELAVDDQGVSMFVDNVVNRNSKYIRVKLDNGKYEQPLTSSLLKNWMTLGSGYDGITAVSDADIMAALDLYSNAEEVDVNILIDSDKSEDVKRYMIQICESRKDCMAVLDCMYSDVVNQRGSEAINLRDWRRGLSVGGNLNENTSYAAVYGNWLEVYNRYSKKYVWIPSSGYVAGIYARTDDTNDAWWAPAGLNRGILTGVRRLAWNPNQGQRDLLYSNGINPITSFSGQGKVVWGQKNLLDKNSAFNRVNARRLMIVIAKSVATASKYFLFEPNDSGTRRTLVNMLEPFLRQIKAKRGLHAYSVVCDDSNNPPAIVDANQLNVSIYLQLTKTAEVIEISLIATQTGASFTELATNGI